MLCNIVDIHCHILPGIDDGPNDYEESIRMVSQAIQQGITTIIATPHYPYGKREYEKEEVFEKVEILKEKINTSGLQCNIYPGMELYLSSKLIQEIDSDKIIPLRKDSKFLLVEFPFHNFSKNLFNILHEINIRGFTPIVAHPERYHFFHDDPSLINNLLQQQVLMQINASSILGENGLKSQRIAIELIKRGLGSFVASDAHSSNWRSIKLYNSFKKLKSIIPRYELKKLFSYNGEKIINGRKINQPICEFKTEKPNIFNILKKAIGLK